MSQIKVRAWDKGVMSEPMGLLLREAPGWLASLSSEAVLLLFTSLRDKHGKEIYEGDIVKWLGYVVRSGRQVRFGRWMVVGQGYVAPNIVSGNYILDCYHLQNLIEQGDKSVEVIGNIYQHPELLDGP